MSISPTIRIVAPTCPVSGVIDMMLTGGAIARNITSGVSVITRSTAADIVMIFRFLDVFVRNAFPQVSFQWLSGYL